MIEKIDRTISAIEQAKKWEPNVSRNNPFDWKTKLSNLQCDLENIKFALSESPSVAAYGESQMGKSYLISALLSNADTPFYISDGTKNYDFINEINPSAPDAQNEATGMVTRFTKKQADGQANPEWLKVHLLSIADIILVLTEAWYGEVIREERKYEDIRAGIDKRIQDTPHNNYCQDPLLSDVDLAYISRYIQDGDSSSGFQIIRESNLIPFLRNNVGWISKEDTISLIQLFWNNNEDFNRLFNDLLNVYHSIDYVKSGYVEFEAVLRKHGTILDVERLTEMYSKPSERVGSDYRGSLKFRTSPSKENIILRKPFLSAIASELDVCITESENTANKTFLENFDILDFPGLKPKDERHEKVLGTGDNLAVVFRRGKVTYLFKKYSSTKRIISLLFCHNHNDSNACKMGPVLSQWVESNVGKSYNDRRQTEADLGKSPLLVISTWFNKNLEYNEETENSDLNERWVRRFGVLANQVLKSKDQAQHWFNSWTGDGDSFRSIFLLRSFKFSKSIFPGYDPNKKTPERPQDHLPEAFPDYMERLRDSFLHNSFVQKRFVDPVRSWEGSATPTNDGTKLIISHLNELAPKANDARNKKFQRDLGDIMSNLLELLKTEYHDNDPSEETKKSKKEVGRVILGIENNCGYDPYYWCGLMESMMIPERVVREMIFSQINGNQVFKPLSGSESQIFMAAGLDTENTADENLQRLCDYLGADDREECEKLLEECDPNIEIDKLLQRSQMVEGVAEQLLTQIEQLWQTDFLSVQVAGGNGSSATSTIVAKLVALYNVLEVHKVLVHEIQHLMNTINRDKQVGIVASWLTMSLNKFVGEFGYSYINQDTLRSVSKKNEDFGLNIDMEILDNPPQAYGIDLLRQVDAVRHRLEQDPFTAEVRDQQKLLPQFRSRWQWENRMRVAFAIVSGLRNYNIEANNELKRIIESVK